MLPIPKLAPNIIQHFPHPSQALNNPDGLLCYGGSLAPEQLLRAYRQGVFPWYGAGEPILWWSPSQRAMLFCAEFHSSRSLNRRRKSQAYHFTRNLAFAKVIKHCARLELGIKHNWINPQMQAAYIQLHQLGHAHSFECWLDGRLIGGLYGVVIGSILCGESMFSLASDASKLVLQHICQSGEFEAIDCQIMSAHLQSLGAKSVARDDFIALLKR